MVKIRFLGTGNAFGHNGNLNSCYFIEASSNILLDCGPAIFSALKKNNLSITDIDAILLSHLHPDHILGLPQLLIENYYVIKRTEAISIYCPVGTENMIRRLADIMYDKKVADHISTLFKFIEFQENETRDIPGGSVTTYIADHSGNARMQFISIDGKTIGYTGDTSYIKKSYDKLLKADIMITEASSAGFSIPNHITLEEIIQLDVPNHCRVYLSHLGQSVIDRKNEIKAPFYLAEDNLVIEI